MQQSGGFFDKEQILSKLEQLSKQTQQPNFWDNPDEAATLMQEKNHLERFIDQTKQIQTLQKDLDFMAANPEFTNEIPATEQQLEALVSKLYLECAFNQPCDKLDCFIHIQAGAGGLESEDWAGMLLRMYSKYCEKKGFKCKLQDLHPGEQGNLISKAIIEVQADKEHMPYGWLKHEHGIHRLVRISPFDSNGKRHTSFASVWITPKLNTSIQVNINPNDLEIRECRASGAGGQHVNKTNSAIQILHKPSGITTQSQQERSQHQNREIAMNLLKSRLYVYEQEKLQKANEKHIMEKSDVSWGNQIRSYTLHPTQRVKDKRTNLELYNANEILNGELDAFINASIELDVVSKT